MTDTARIAKEIFQHSRPYLLDTQKDILDAVDDGVDEMMREGGPVASIFRTIIREELAAFEARQPSPAVLGENISKTVVEGVKQVVKTTSRARTVDEMGRKKLHAAVLTTIDVDTI